ncbi:hypothetical protein H6P81_003163 [Aristolochia fimbriata]|uniref:Uncharacterized protein n=1 Tax=Aristolochia fimbriata TaxID=158543 RepID=A0AAV7FBT2_ARIFI|nr:hypothetical protein H6P81_003163 [Aristolochia fimbriata]
MGTGFGPKPCDVFAGWFVDNPGEKGVVGASELMRSAAYLKFITWFATYQGRSEKRREISDQQLELMLFAHGL